MCFFNIIKEILFEGYKVDLILDQYLQIPKVYLKITKISHQCITNLDVHAELMMLWSFQHRSQNLCWKDRNIC